MARKVDDLGRIVLPSELRRLHGIVAGDELDISVDGSAIVLRKRTAACVFCSATDDLEQFRDRPVCAGCRRELSARSEAHRVGATGAGIAGSAGNRECVDLALGDAEVSGDPGDGGLAIDSGGEEIP